MAGHGLLHDVQRPAEVRCLDHPPGVRPGVELGRDTPPPLCHEAAALKETDGAPIIIHGSARLGASLADAGLVESESYSNGLQKLVYDVVK